MCNGYPILSILVFLPLAGGLLLVPFWKRESVAKAIALFVASLELIISCWAYGKAPVISAGSSLLPGFFLTEDIDWISRFGIRYSLGMDGISLLLTMLTAFIIVIAMIVAWQGVNRKGTLHYLLILGMETGIMGVFLSLDLFLFYLFWEVMLIPMFFLIGIWGYANIA